MASEMGLNYKLISAIEVKSAMGMNESQSSFINCSECGGNFSKASEYYVDF